MVTDCILATLKNLGERQPLGNRIRRDCSNRVLANNFGVHLNAEARPVRKLHPSVIPKRKGIEDQIRSKRMIRTIVLKQWLDGVQA